MSLYGITMVKNEQDTIGQVIEHLLAEGLDHVIVANNLSTDRTAEVLAGLVERGLPVTVVEDNEFAYLQGVKMTRLAAMAREAGATWVVPFDADELWMATATETSLSQVLRESDDADVLIGEWFDHLPPVGPAFGRSCFQRMTRRDLHPSDLPKVAFRPLPGANLYQGNHSVNGVDGLREVRGRIVVHHYRWRSLGHFIRKSRNGQAVYAAGGGLLEPGWGKEWRRYGQRSRLHLALTYLNLIRFQRMKGTVPDPVQPRRLVEERV